MNPNSKRLIAVYEDGQTPSAWLRLMTMLMLCYATIIVLGLLRALDLYS
jgi:hypothetical protein